MHKRDLIAVSSWIGIAFGLWVIAWIIASAIPVFSNLLSLMVGHISSCFPSSQPPYQSINLTFQTDRSLRQLVHLWLPRDLLAVYEPGRTIFHAQEDRLDGSERCYYLYWLPPGMFLFLLFPSQLIVMLIG